MRVVGAENRIISSFSPFACYLWGNKIFFLDHAQITFSTIKTFFKQIRMDYCVENGAVSLLSSANAFWKASFLIVINNASTYWPCHMRRTCYNKRIYGTCVQLRNFSLCGTIPARKYVGKNCCNLFPPLCPIPSKSIFSVFQNAATASPLFCSWCNPSHLNFILCKCLFILVRPSLVAKNDIVAREIIKKKMLYSNRKLKSDIFFIKVSIYSYLCEFLFSLYLSRSKKS